MAIAQVEIDILGLEGGEIGRGVDADVPFGIFGQKRSDPGAKPAHPETGADADDKVAEIALPGDRATGIADRAEGLRRGLKENLPVLRERQATLFTAEKLDPELAFQMPDLLADGGWRNAKLRRRLGHRSKPGHGFEILDCLDVDVAHGRRLAKPRAPGHSALPVQGFSSTSMKLIGTVPLLTTLCSTPAVRL